jgi:hypothetical protein
MELDSFKIMNIQSRKIAAPILRLLRRDLKIAGFKAKPASRPFETLKTKLET